MTYIPDQSKVVSISKDQKKEKTFDALEWLTAMCSHVPDKREQMVGYHGYYSNISRGKTEKNQDAWISRIRESDESSKELRKNWARLNRRVEPFPGLIRESGPRANRPRKI
jgi:hypothetical protein